MPVALRIPCVFSAPITITPPPPLQTALIYLESMEESNPFLAFRPTTQKNSGLELFIQKSLINTSEQQTHWLL